MELSAEHSVLAAEVLYRSGRLRLQVGGESMLPVLWPRDVVEIARCSVEEVRPGEIVLALREGRFFLHRFVGRCPDGFLLRGDSMPQLDLPYPDVALLGRLIARQNQRTTLPLRPWSWAVGRLVCHCTIARRAALRIHALLTRQGIENQSFSSYIFRKIFEFGFSR